MSNLFEKELRQALAGREILKSDAVMFGRFIPTYRRNTQSGIYFCTENGDSRFLQSVFAIYQI
jgi:hypothetical protein